MFNKIANFIGGLIFNGFLDDGERIMYIAHRHIFVYYRIFLKQIFFGILIPSFTWYLFPGTYSIMAIWLVIGSLFFLHVVSDWYLDAILITNLSIKVVTWNGFFDSSSTTFEYEKIEGVSWSKKGFLQTIFGYGDVTIERVGTGNGLVLKDAVNPKEIERHIVSQQGLVVEENTLKNYETLHSLLTDMVLQHKARSK